MYRQIYKSITLKSLDDNPNQRTYQLKYVKSVSIVESIDNNIISATITIPAPVINYNDSTIKGKKTTVNRANTKHRFYFTQDSFKYEGKIRIKNPVRNIHYKKTEGIKKTYDVSGYKVEDIKLSFNAFRTLISIYVGYKEPMQKTIVTEREVAKIGGTNEKIKSGNTDSIDVLDTEQIPYNFIGVATRFEFDIQNNCYIIHCQDLSAILSKKRMTISFPGGNLSDFISAIFYKAGYYFDTKALVSTSLKTEPPANFNQYNDYYRKEIESNPQSKYYRGVSVIEDISVYLQIDEIILPPITIRESLSVSQIFKMLEESYGVNSYFGLTSYNNSSILYFHSGYKYIRFNKFKLPQTFSYPIANMRKDEAPVINLDLSVESYIPKTEGLAVIYSTMNNNISTTLYTIDGKNCFTDKEIVFDKNDPEQLRISSLITVKERSEIEKDLSTRTDRREMKMINLPIVDLYNFTVNVWKSVPDSGFIGSLTTFGDYNIHKSDRIGLKVDNLSKSGESLDYYFVDGVDILLDSSVGIQQTINFKTKLS